MVIRPSAKVKTQFFIVLFASVWEWGNSKTALLAIPYSLTFAESLFTLRLYADDDAELS